MCIINITHTKKITIHSHYVISLTLDWDTALFTFVILSKLSQ